MHVYLKYKKRSIGYRFVLNFLHKTLSMLRFMYAWLEIEGKQASADKSEKNIKLHFIGIM